MCVCVCACMCVSIYLYIHTYVYIYIKKCSLSSLLKKYLGANLDPYTMPTSYRVQL